MGVHIVLNHEVGDLVQEMESGNFDAAFLGIGAHVSRRTDIPARDAGRIYDDIGRFQRVEPGELPQIGRRVAIYGRGNSSMDAARTAKRLGAEEELIIYRRTRGPIPAHDFEADEAMKQGIKIQWLPMISEIDGTEFKVEVLELDESGYPQPTGRYESLEVDSLVMALGQDVDASFLRRIPDVMFKTDGTIEVDENMMTGHAGLFAGGDMVPSGRTVSVAMGHGLKAARNIDGFLESTHTGW
jgi:NADPH-dependent glutamate synthase beta subunit-like oxidoreductase